MGKCAYLCTCTPGLQGLGVTCGAVVLTLFCLLRVCRGGLLWGRLSLNVVRITWECDRRDPARP